MSKLMPNRAQTLADISQSNEFDGIKFKAMLRASKDDSNLKRINMRPIRSRLPNDHLLHLPTDFQKSSDLYHISEFENKYCRFPLTHSGDLAKPVLKETPNAFAKQCTQTFKCILNCEKNGNLKDADALVDLARAQPEIVNDVFFQLLMQSTTKNVYVWKLFLIICTLFAPSKINCRWLQQYFRSSGTSNGTDTEISDLAKLCYIRLPHITNVVTKKNEDIPEEALSGKLKFGVTITEQMFNQRQTYPKLPIPIILFRIISALLEKKCGQVEGIFRLPGNKKNVDEIAQNINNTLNFSDIASELNNAQINDLASLLKKWIHDLPNPPVSFETVDALEFDAQENSFVEFTELLTRANQTSLMYIVGFLQHLLEFQELSKMNEKNYAICFAPAIVRLADDAPPAKIKLMAEIAINFMEHLIVRWDTNIMFPMKNEYIE